MSSKRSLSHRSNTSEKSGGSGTSRRSSTHSASSCPSECALGLRSPIPCGTMLVVIVCIFIHLELVNLPLLYVKNSCSGLYQVFYLQEYSRIFLCHIVHANPWELSFQMLSFLWKGHQLEKCCGPIYLIVMLLIFAPLCSISLFVFHKLLTDVLDPVFITQCFCGFGSINFALKVIKMYQAPDPGVQCILGSCCFKLKYFSWAEIIVSHLVSSTATIAANMAGVVVGVLYLSGILQFVISTIVSLTTGTVGLGLNLGAVKGWLSSALKKSSVQSFTGSLSNRPSSRRFEPTIGADGSSSEASIHSS